jgi:hypothetical protein
MFKKIILISTFSMLNYAILANESEPIYKPCDLQHTEDDNKFLDEYHCKFSNYIFNKSTSLDHFIGSPDEEILMENNSYAVLNIKQKFYSKSENKTQIDLNVKIDLPYSEKKWKLFLDTNNNDFDPLVDKNRESYTSNANFIENASDTVGGLLFTDLKNEWKKKYRIGTKLNFPLNPFIKANFYHTTSLNNKLTQYFEQEFFYYNEEGFGTNTNLNYYYQTDSNFIIQSNSAAQFLNDNDNNWELTQKFSAWEQLTDKSTIKYSIGISANSRPDLKVTNYWINAKWRHKLYKEWLYVKIIPEISFREEFDYKPDYGVLLQFEMFFAKNKYMNRLTTQY